MAQGVDRPGGFRTLLPDLSRAWACLMPRQPKDSFHSSPATAGRNSATSLVLLGSFTLKRGDDIKRLPKKAQGLLAYLAMHPGRQIARDQLATLLWGNTATEQARQSLRQCLTAVRTALGADAGNMLVADTASVMLQPADGIAIDVTAFESTARLSSAEDLERASAFYKGEFLAGLHIPVEPFNDWLSLERQRLSVLRSDLLLRLAQAHATAGNLQAAITASRELTNHDPLREEGHRLLMRLLANAGQRTAALKQHAKLTRLLSEQLGIAPDAETAALAEELRSGNPERTTTNQLALRPIATNAPQDESMSVATIREIKQPMLLDGPALPDKPSIVVLPFSNLSGDPAQDYFVDGLVDDITIALGREKWLFVIASPSAFAFRDRNSDPRDIAAKLGVRYVLRGSVRKSASRVRVVVLLTDAASGEFLWSDRFEDVADNVFDLNDRLMTHVAAMIAPAVRTVEIERAQRKPPASLSAFELYLKAVPKLRTGLSENQRALQLLEQAIALDASYSVAYGLAARCLQFQRFMGWVPLKGLQLERGAGFAQLAVEIGKNDSEALWMASHAITHFTGDIDHARDLIDRSLTLNPNSASAWTTSCHVHMLLGEYDRAIEHFQLAQRLNPLDRLHHVHWNIVGMAYFGSGRYEDANAAADKALSVLPTYPMALRLKIAACGALGRGSEGRTYVQRLLAVHPECSTEWLEQFFTPLMSKTPKLLKSYVAAARKGGMPDGRRRVFPGSSVLQ